MERNGKKWKETDGTNANANDKNQNNELKKKAKQCGVICNKCDLIYRRIIFKIRVKKELWLELIDEKKVNVSFYNSTLTPAFKFIKGVGEIKIIVIIVRYDKLKFPGTWIECQLK